VALRLLCADLSIAAAVSYVCGWRAKGSWLFAWDSGPGLGRGWGREAEATWTSSGPADLSREGLDEASSGLAIRKPPRAWERLRSPFIVIPVGAARAGRYGWRWGRAGLRFGETMRPCFAEPARAD